MQRTVAVDELCRKIEPGRRVCYLIVKRARVSLAEIQLLLDDQKFQEHERVFIRNYLQIIVPH